MNLETFEPNLIALVKALRNHREPKKNWAAFRKLVEGNIDLISTELSTRWIISIVDTYIDYAEKEQARHAMTISMFMNMMRLGETVKFVRPVLDNERIKQASKGPIMFNNGLNTFSIQRQDVFLNLTKRFYRQVKDDAVMFPIWQTLLKRLHESENIITDFSSNSAVKQRYFPLNPEDLTDNYGL